MTDIDHIDMDEVGDATVAEIMERRAREAPDHIFCHFEGRAHTYAEINQRANALGNGLLALGLQPGDRVGIMLPSHPDHIIAIFALMKAGLIRFPVNTHFKGAALDYLFDQFEPHALIIDAAYADQAKPSIGPARGGRIVWRGAASAAPDSFEAIVAGGDRTVPPVRNAADDILAFTPSSGTTGPSKGVLKSDRTLRAGPLGIKRLTGMNAGDVLLLWEPLHHGAGVAVVIAAALEPITLAMVDRFSASQLWDQARRYGVTHVHYLGGVVQMLLKQPPRGDDRDHKVRIAWGGGCPVEAINTLEQRFGVTVREGYGLSEMITFVTVNVDGKHGSIGKPLSCFDVKLADDDGAEVPVGKVGEIRVRARVPGLHFLGYFRNAEATEAAMRGEWCCTGDLARRDEQGYLYFAGRKKDVVRRRGVNISAWEVERVVVEHEAIEECALVGVPSELGDDDLKLFVRLAPGRQLDPLDLIKWCEPRLPYFQIPRYVAFIAEFPKTPTQRIKKADLSRAVVDCWDLETSGYKIERKR